jgi:hypothetical protein
MFVTAPLRSRLLLRVRNPVTYRSEKISEGPCVRHMSRCDHHDDARPDYDCAGPSFHGDCFVSVSGLFAFVVASAFARSPAPEVTFVSPCECIGFHGKNRWVSKTDLTPVPSDIRDSIGRTVADLRMGRAWAGCGLNAVHRSANAV